ncbi:MAG: hypothetical protein HYS16_01390 [Deltaproteobacteria bacterium]|nr:MAG: hypothetical protein HYS16_01390 [Deltaproteobacteria bacterium]
MCFCSQNWLHLILDKPRIIANIAAIARLTTGLQISLHICGPLIFENNDKTKWRASLDYLQHTCIHFHQNIFRCLHVLEKKPWIIEIGSLSTIWESSFQIGDCLILGPEIGHISPQIMQKLSYRKLSIPQPGPIRSLNLAQCASIVTFEAIRQIYNSHTFLP